MYDVIVKVETDDLLDVVDRNMYLDLETVLVLLFT